MCAARRVNMRERPINVKKPMAIVKGDTDEVVSAEEQVGERTFLHVYVYSYPRVWLLVCARSGDRVI